MVLGLVSGKRLGNSTIHIQQVPQRRREGRNIIMIILRDEYIIILYSKRDDCSAVNGHIIIK